jgi:hypothetical protein
VIKSDPVFAETYAKQSVDRCKLIVAACARTLFDRDTAPGAEPEDLMRVDIPALSAHCRCVGLPRLVTDEQM